MIKRKKARRGLTIIAALFLLLSTFLPSIPVKASNESIAFTMKQISGYEFSDARFKITNSNSESQFANIYAQDQNLEVKVDPSQQYTIEMFANLYTQDFSNHVVYYGKKGMSGTELQQQGLIWEPEENLAEIVLDFTDFSLSSSGIKLYSSIEGKNTQEFTQPMSETSTKLLISSTNQLHAIATGKGSDNKHYLLSFQTPQASGTWKLKDEQDKAVPVTFNGKEDEVELSSINIFKNGVYAHSLYLNGKETNEGNIFVSPNNYNIQLTTKTNSDSPTTSSANWMQEAVSINEATTITYSAYPDRMEIKDLEVNYSSINVETAVYSGDFRYEWGNFPQLIGEIKVEDEQKNEVVKEVHASGYFGYFNIQVPKLEGHTYTVTTEIKNIETGEIYASASAETMEFPGRKDKDLNGAVITAEDLDGNQLKGANVRLFEKVNGQYYADATEKPFSSYWLNLIYQTKIEEKNELTEAFIPNAYLLKGKEYELIVEGITADNKKIIYHKSFVGGEESVIAFTKDQLSKLNVETEKKYDQQALMIEIVDQAQSLPASWPMLYSPESIHSDLYIQTNLEARLTGRFYDKENNELTILSKAVKTVSGEPVSIVLENESFSEILPPAGFKKSSIDVSIGWNFNAEASKIKINDDFQSSPVYKELGIQIVVTDQFDYEYRFWKWVNEVPKQLQLKIPEKFTGYVNNSAKPGVVTWIPTSYRNFEENMNLQSIRKSPSMPDATEGITFQALQKDGTVQQWNVSDEDGTTKYEEGSTEEPPATEVPPAVPPGAGAGTSESLIRYQLYSGDEAIGGPIHTNYVSKFELMAPKEKGEYQLKLEKQGFSKDVIQLQMDSMLIVGEEEFDNRYFNIDVVSGDPEKQILRKDFTLYRIDENDYPLHLYSGYDIDQINAFIPNIKDSDRFVFVVNGEFINSTSTYSNSPFVDFVELTGAELKQLSTLVVLSDVERVDIETAFSKKHSQSTYLAMIPIGNKDYYHPVNLYSYHTPNTFSFYIKPGAYSFQYRGMNGETGYILTKEADVTKSTKLGFSDKEKLSAITLKQAEGKLQPFMSAYLQPKGKSMPMNHIGYYYPYNNGLLKTLYVTPDQYQVGFVLLKTESNETPWKYNFMAEANADSDLALAFNGFDITPEIGNIGIFQSYKDETYISTGVSVRSGDLNLSSVSVYREDLYRNTLGINMEEPSREYDGEFNQTKWINPTIKVYEVSTGKLVHKTEGISPTYISFGLGAPNGQYKLVYDLPFGPKKSLTANKIFSIGQQGNYVSIGEPANQSLQNNRTIAINGEATPNADITIEASKDGKIAASQNVKVNDKGKYSAAITVSEDGIFELQAYIVGKKDVQSNKVTVEIDTKKPAAPVNLKAEQVKNAIILTWDQVSDASKYVVYAAKKGEAFTEATVTENSLTLNEVEPGTTYEFKVTAVDKAGNHSDPSKVIDFTTASFAVTNLKVNTGENAYNLLTIGNDIEMIMQGSYEEGFTGHAELSYLENGKEETKEITFAYDKENKQYAAQTTIREGMAKIVEVKGWIENGAEKTDVITTSINKEVGATFKGNITDGGKSLTQAAKLTLVGKRAISVDTDEKGNFIFSGIPSGDYSINITYPVKNGKTIYNVLNGKATLLNGTMKLLESPIDLPAYRDIQVKFIENDDKSAAVTESLSVNITGPNHYYVYGYIGKDGFFTTWNNENTLYGLESGEYTVRVYKSGIYEETKSNFTINAETDITTPFEVKVDKLTKETVDVEITFTNEDLKSIDNISLFSWDAYQKYGYSGLGSYYVSYKDLTNGTITIPNVVYDNNYELYVYKDGYRQFNQSGISINAENHSIGVEMDQGRTIKGKVEDGEGNPIKSGNVYAYSKTSYASTVIKGGSFELVGLASDEEVTLTVNSPDYFEVTKTIAQNEEQELEIILEKASFIEGKVVDKDSKPLQYVYINAYNKEGQYKGWTRSDENGYFKIRNIKPGTYKLEISHYDYPTLVVEGVENAKTDTYILQDQSTSSFTGKGNSLTASKQIVVPGKTLQYRLNYQNNGDKDVDNVSLNVTLPENVRVIEKTVVLNGHKETAWNNGSIEIGKVEKGASGTLVFEVDVSPTAESAIYTTAMIQSGDTESEVLSSTTNVLFATINAPSTTKSDKVKVYGSAKPGSTVEVFANGISVAKVKVDGRWWFADINLPIKDAAKEAQFNLVAKVTDGENTATSESIQVKYDPSIPAIKEATVYAGWNGNVSLSPYTGLATFAITETTPLDTKIEFTDEVDEASIIFLGKTYKMKADSSKKKFTFDGSQLGQWRSYGEQLLEVTFKKGNITVTLPLMEIIVLIDPSGFVFEGSMSNPLEGVTAVVEEKVGEEWKQWNAAFFGQVNPQVTDAEGRYGWDVIKGDWRVIFTKKGYAPYISRIVQVPPPETELNVPLVRTAPPQIETVTPAQGSSEVKKDAVMTVNFDRLMNVEDAAQKLKLFKVNGEERTEVAGTVEPKNKVFGYKESVGNPGFFEEDTTKGLAKSFIFKPSADLVPSAAYEFEIMGTFEDYDGKTLDEVVSYSFTTEDQTTPEQPGDDGNEGEGPGGSTPPPAGGGSPSGNAPVPPATEKPVESGKAIEFNEKAMKVEGDKATVNEADVLAAINKAEKLDQLVFNTSEKVNEFVVSPKVIDALKAKSKQSSIQIVKENASYILPMNEINVQELAKKLGAGSANDIEVSIVVKPSNASLEKLIGVSVISEAMEYAVQAVYNGKKVAIDSFKQYVERTITLSQPVNASKSIAVKLTKDGFVPVPTTFNGQKAIIKSMTNSTYVVITSDQTFTDVNNGASWAEEYIESLASKYIVKGVGNDQYAPGQEMTRAQFTVMLVRALGLPAEVYNGAFKDVKGTEWFNQSGELMAAVKYGIIKGKGEGTFAPNDTITRAEAAVMIARVLEMNLTKVDHDVYDPSKKVSDLKDHKQMNEWSKASIEKIYQSGIMSGHPDGTFDPNGKTKRDQMAKILAEMLNKIF